MLNKPKNTGEDAVNNTRNIKNYINDSIKQNKNILKNLILYDLLVPCEIYMITQKSGLKKIIFNTLFFTNNHRKIINN